jgi:hypothetical protein
VTRLRHSPGCGQRQLHTGLHECLGIAERVWVGEAGPTEPRVQVNPATKRGASFRRLSAGMSVAAGVRCPTQRPPVALVTGGRSPRSKAPTSTRPPGRIGRTPHVDSFEVSRASVRRLDPMGWFPSKRSPRDGHGTSWPGSHVQPIPAPGRGGPTRVTPPLPRRARHNAAFVFAWWPKNARTARTRRFSSRRRTGTATWVGFMPPRGVTSAR